MNENVNFLTGIGTALVVSFTVVAYLRPHVRAILVDLCGTRERAGFWTAFSNVTLVLTPLICSLIVPPGGGGPVLMEISKQLLWAFIGLLAAVTLMGFAISLFIPLSRITK